MFDPQQIKEEYNDMLLQLADPEIVSDWEKFERLSKRKKVLDGLLEKISSLDGIKKQIAENETIISAGEDSDLITMANEEIEALKEKETKLQAEMENLAKSGSQENSSAIIEIRAGVGGEEAALWARRLFELYSGFAKLQGWHDGLLDSSETDIGGFKEVIFELRPGSGPCRDIFSKMKYEAGVHRVQRIPETEKSGRIHTSTATVAVLKKPKSAGGFKINPKDVQVDFFNASGPGGQNVNKRKTAVRVVHIPSGMVVTSRTERNQLQNRESALAILAARLSEQKLSASQESVVDARRAQIGQAKRAEKIRTYNFPQDRLTDHRIKKSWKNLQEILKGKLDPIIDELEKQLPNG
ncbi:MAG: PCRF domain-containing protein [bacterium]|nr:PCRF domain-containing protein [bacterium]